MNLRQLCNVTYAYLAEGRDQTQLAELDQMMSDPDRREEIRNRQNMQSLQGITALLGGVQR